MARKKKRGVKPGTKRGPYKKTVTVRSISSIADEMDAALENLETRLRAVTKRINAIMKV